MDKKAIEGEDAEKAKDLFDEFITRYREDFDNKTKKIGDIIKDIKREIKLVAVEKGYGEDISAKLWHEIVAPKIGVLINTYIY